MTEAFTGLAAMLDALGLMPLPRVNADAQLHHHVAHHDAHLITPPARHQGRRGGAGRFIT
jgi:hypothetical protein